MFARRMLAALGALLLLALLMPRLVSLTMGTAAVSEGREPAREAELQPALAHWQALWSRLATEGVTALEPDIADPSLRAAGDTAFMRYRNLWDQVPATARRDFQLAALANDPEHKQRLLKPWRDAEIPLIRFRAWLEQARIALRQQDPGAAAAAARTALEIPALPAPVRADAAFILGYLALQAGALDQAEAQLARAIRDDPGFWDARQLHLRVLGALLAQSDSRPARCLNHTRALIEQLGALPALAQDRTQFRDIADQFARQTHGAHPALALMTGLGYLWAGETERARGQLTLAAQGHEPGPGPPMCRQRIAEQARAWLRRLPKPFTPV